MQRPDSRKRLFHGVKPYLAYTIKQPFYGSGSAIASVIDGWESERTEKTVRDVTNFSLGGLMRYYID